MLEKNSMFALHLQIAGGGGGVVQEETGYREYLRFFFEVKDAT
jgi:hypothetical protein